MNDEIRGRSTGAPRVGVTPSRARALGTSTAGAADPGACEQITNFVDHEQALGRGGP
jgi:hypothetical protein